MNHGILILTLALGRTALAAATAGLAVDNRPAREDEWGYRPADGSTSAVNPPSFTWIHDDRARTYEIQWTDAPEGKTTGTALNHPWNVYTHNAPFAPGRWHWRYRFVTAKGETSGWSVARSVVVPADAVAFPMPTRAEQRARVPEGRPRLFMRPDDLPRLRTAAREPGPAAKMFADIRKAADKLIAAGPTPEPKHMGSARNKDDDEAVKHWWPNRAAAVRAGQEAETLAFTWLMTQEPKYGEAARRFIMALAAWDPDGPSNFRLNCEAGKVMLYHPSRAYDWAYDALTPEDREVFRKVMSRRVADAWASGEISRGVGHLSRPYNSHGNRIWHKVAEAAIALYGEMPEAEQWLDYAVNKFFAVYPVWADDDGGWHEGAAYYSSYVSRVTEWMTVAERALGINGMKKPFFSEIGNFPLHVTPPNSPSSGFGDLSHGKASFSFLDFFARMKGADPRDAAEASQWAWWLKQNKIGLSGGWKGFLAAANMPPLPEPVAPDGSAPSMVFRGTGVAALNSTLLDGNDNVQMLFKASPFGTRSHGHDAQLSIHLSAYGEVLLPAMTFRDLHGSRFHYQWVHTTRAQNSILVDGSGQRAHSSASVGRILDSRFDPKWDYVRGEAAAAYTGRVSRAERSIVFVKPDLLVLFDDFSAPRPATYQFMLHGYAPFEINESAQTLKLDLKKAGLVIRYLSPTPLIFAQTDGYDPPPKYREGTKPFPNQWHVEASTRTPAVASDTITVMIPHRAGGQQEWTAERVDSTSAAGVRIRRGGQTIGVAFRRDGVDAMEWDGRTYEGPVAVHVSE